MDRTTRLIVAVDFDNTLIKSCPYPSIDYEFMPDAEFTIRTLNKSGVRFVLNTARRGWFRLPAIYFIKHNKLPIRCNLINNKPFAHLYIDDSNIFCNNIDWNQIYNEILLKLKED